MVDLGDRGDVHEPDRQRQLLAARPAGDPLAVPAREDVQQRLLHLGAEPQPPRDRRRDLAVRRHRLGSVAPAGRHQRRGHPRPPQRRTPGADPAQQEADHRQAGEIDPMGVGAQREVVAELVRQLVRVGRAADPRQHRHVVHGGPLRLVQTQPLREPQRDPALTQHMLLRQPEAEIGRQRPGGDQLGQAQAHRAQTNRGPATAAPWRKERYVQIASRSPTLRPRASGSGSGRSGWIV